MLTTFQALCWEGYVCYLSLSTLQHFELKLAVNLIFQLRKQTHKNLSIDLNSPLHFKCSCCSGFPETRSQKPRLCRVIVSAIGAWSHEWESGRRQSGLGADVLSMYRSPLCEQGIRAGAGFPAGSVVKNLPANAGDPGSSSVSGRSPGGGGKGNLLQYSAWEILWTEESGWAKVHRVAKSRTWLSDWAHMQVHWSRTRAKFSKENRISESSVSICFSFSDNLKVHLILIF